MPPKRTHVRWGICALLFFATTINYIDRQVIGILKPELTEKLGWNEIDYSNIIFWFQCTYALGYLIVGRVIDRVGVRIGMAASVGLWSVAAMLHAAMRSVTGFCFARAGLGLAEGGNFPGCTRAVSEWFPKSERALAFGIFNAGSNVGALVTPLLVPWLAVRWGWPSAFLVTGALGFVWLVAWWWMYTPPLPGGRASAAELAHIHSDPPDPIVKVAWLELLRHRQTWAFVTGMFLTGPVWWFYLFWIPDFLHKTHGLDILQLGPPLVVIYLMTDVGSIGGGWLSSRLIKGGWSVNAGRKTAMLICACCVVPVFFTAWITNLWVATIILGLAASAHQGFAANLYTMVSDTAPRSLVGSIVGIGGTAAAVGGMLVAKFVGYVLEWTHSYVPMFVLASLAYLVAIGIIHWLNPRHESMKLTES